jgi:ubiquinone/menaquinone biosynthesis C-methylase UbiE
LSYHETVADVYRQAAVEPDEGLCCVSQAPRYLPGLTIPSIMHEMNYGCGTTIHLEDMKKEQTALYVGVGGGLEALQLAYFTRKPGGVIAVDPVPEMRAAATRNLELAAAANPWFDPSFVKILDGDARDLPVDDDSIDVAAQNCLFNIFKIESGDGDLERALREMHRVLKPQGRLVMTDPIATRPMPAHLQDDEVLRAKCISGCLTYEAYLESVVEAGFGQMEVRARVPYRMLTRDRYELEEDLLLDSLEVCAFKTPIPPDGPCIFTGRMAIYTGARDVHDDGNGHLLPRDIPVGICDKTAGQLGLLGNPEITITPSTWHYRGGGCC